MLRSGAWLCLALLATSLAGPGQGHQDIAMVPVALGARVLNVARHEVTVADWNSCVVAGACDSLAPRVADTIRTPMTGINWFDVQDYLAWHNRTHATQVRLPTADEWRAVSRKPEPVPRKPLFDDPRLAWAANYGQEETPRGPVRLQGAWGETPNGIADMDGNVWEWTSTCASPGAADNCPAMTVMGAHRTAISVFVRDAASGGCATGLPPTHIGFRLVADPP
ncbi:MAG: SUMF1/EgtB/PvdO family nonheme iron enzyme [Hyphomicrobiales bacterium]